MKAVEDNKSNLYFNKCNKFDHKSLFQHRICCLICYFGKIIRFKWFVNDQISFYSNCGYITWCLAASWTLSTTTLKPPAGVLVVADWCGYCRCKCSTLISSLFPRVAESFSFIRFSGDSATESVCEFRWGSNHHLWICCRRRDLVCSRCSTLPHIPVCVVIYVLQHRL